MNPRWVFPSTERNCVTFCCVVRRPDNGASDTRLRAYGKCECTCHCCCWKEERKIDLKRPARLKSTNERKKERFLGASNWRRRRRMTNQVRLSDWRRRRRRNFFNGIGKFLYRKSLHSDEHIHLFDITVNDAQEKWMDGLYGISKVSIIKMH